MNAVLNAAVVADVPGRPFVPGPRMRSSRTRLYQLRKKIAVSPAPGSCRQKRASQ